MLNDDDMWVLTQARASIHPFSTFRVKIDKYWQPYRDCEEDELQSGKVVKVRCVACTGDQ